MVEVTLAASSEVSICVVRINFRHYKSFLLHWLSWGDILIRYKLRETMIKSNETTKSLPQTEPYYFSFCLPSRVSRVASKTPIGHFGKYHNTPCLSPQTLPKHCLCFLLGSLKTSRETGSNAYAKFGRTSKEYCSIFEVGYKQANNLLRRPPLRELLIFQRGAWFRIRTCFNVEMNLNLFSSATLLSLVI